MDQPSIACPKCGMVSFNPNDVRERYCGACHAFHDDLLRSSSGLTKAAAAAVHALRSYQYGNSSPELAEEVADALEAAIKKAGPV